MMRPSPAHTRTRTLQGRLGTHQDLMDHSPGENLCCGLTLRKHTDFVLAIFSSNSSGALRSFCFSLRAILFKLPMRACSLRRRVSASVVKAQEFDAHLGNEVVEPRGPFREKVRQRLLSYTRSEVADDISLRGVLAGTLVYQPGSQLGSSECGSRTGSPVRRMCSS